MSVVNVVAEAGLRVVFPTIAGELRSLTASQWDRPQEVQRRSWQRVHGTLKYAYENVPFYREKFDRAGVVIDDVRTPADLLSLPLTTKQELRAALNERWPLSTALSTRQISRASTTGSTGEPFVFPIDTRANDLRMAAVFRNINWYGHRLGDRNVRLWGRPERSPDASVARRLGNRFAREVLGRRLDVYTHDRDRPELSLVDEVTLERWARMLKQQHFRALDGYVSALVLLAKYLLDSGRPGIRCDAVVTGAETLAPTQRALLERGFGCPVYNRYGSSEAGFIAHECNKSPGHQLHVNAEFLWVEFLRAGQPVQPGQLGEIVLTDFTNRAMPLIRYRTNDVGSAARVGEVCPCGRGLPLISTIEGRVDDLFYLPSGEVVVSHIWHEIFADQEFVTAYRVTQHRKDLVEVELVLRRDQLSPRKYHALQQWVESFLPGCSVVWREVEGIPPGVGGKLRSSHSMVASPAF
jgi:phenylacetate-CoA ligase